MIKTIVWRTPRLRPSDPTLRREQARVGGKGGRLRAIGWRKHDAGETLLAGRTVPAGLCWQDYTGDA